MQRNWAWVAAAIAVICAIAVIAGAARLWRLVGSSGISVAGWIALVLGVLLSLGVGVGLMTLVFYSSRHGYDEPGRDDRD